MIIILQISKLKQVKELESSAHSLAAELNFYLHTALLSASTTLPSRQPPLTQKVLGDAHLSLKCKCNISCVLSVGENSRVVSRSENPFLSSSRLQ